MSSPMLVEDGAGMVLHRDQLGAIGDEQLGRDRTHIAEALHRDACAIDVHVQAAHDFTADHIDAAAGGLHAAGRAAERNRLTRDHTPVAVAPTFIE